MLRYAARFRDRHRRPTRGQGLVEFALVLPIILLLTMTALDFGRIYLGYINVQNMARVAANFAANNALKLSAGDAATLTQYRNQIDIDAAATNCRLPGPAPVPVYSDANGDGTTTSLGDNAKVGLTCTFNVITPFISTILGSSINVSTAVVFPVKAGMSGTGTTGGGGCYLPPNASINTAPGVTGPAPFNVTFTDASGGCPATIWLWSFSDGTTTTTSTAQDPPGQSYTTPGTYTVNMRATNPYGYTDAPQVTITVTAPASTPAPCTVPLFSANGGVPLSSAPGIWGAAGFTGTITLVDEIPNNGTTKIKAQTLVGGSLVPCDSQIIVTSN
jgi:Flp pilus assembly protein TadG